MGFTPHPAEHGDHDSRLPSVRAFDLRLQWDVVQQPGYPPSVLREQRHGDLHVDNYTTGTAVRIIRSKPSDSG